MKEYFIGPINSKKWDWMISLGNGVRLENIANYLGSVIF
jgi:hypothetical protein